MGKKALKELLETLISLVAIHPDKYYIKTLFADIADWSYDDMVQALKEHEDDSEIRLLYSKVRDALEARLVEASLQGKVPPSTAQFVLQNVFDMGKEGRFGGQNVVIVYKGLEEPDEDA